MEENNTKMSPSVEWMSKMYDQMNKELFGGALGACSFAVFTSGRGSQGGTLGWFKITNKGVRIERASRRMFINTIYGKEYINSSNFVNYCKPQIELNGNYTGVENSFLCTLVHEMCHYYTYMNGLAPRQGHGPEFYSIGRKVCNLSNGRFNIQRFASAEEMSGYELSAEMQAKRERRVANKKASVYAVICYTSDNKVELTMTSNEDLIHKIADYNKRRIAEPRRGSCKEMIVSNDSGLIELLFENGYRKNMRTYRFWNIESKPFVNQIKDFKYYSYIKKMNEEKIDLRRIVENIVHKFLNEEFEDDSIEINPNMNLGLESPFEAEGIA